MTPFELAQRFVGAITERPGVADHPFIVWCLSIVGLSDAHDEVPWCSAFVNAICWMLRLPRSKSAAARSWLGIGRAVALEDAIVGSDVVILARGSGEQPGADVIQAPGHVGFYAGHDVGSVSVLGGNQGNGISIARFHRSRVLGVRRL